MAKFKLMSIKNSPKTFFIAQIIVIIGICVGLFLLTSWNRSPSDPRLSALFDQLDSSEGVDKAQTLMQIATFYNGEGEYEAAIDYYGRAAGEFEAAGDSTSANNARLMIRVTQERQTDTNDDQENEEVYFNEPDYEPPEERKLTDEEIEALINQESSEEQQ